MLESVGRYSVDFTAEVQKLVFLKEASFDL